MNFRLTHRQRKVLGCLRKTIVIFGRRRSGKSHTAKIFAIKHLLKGENVIFLSSFSHEPRDSFFSIGTILKELKKNEKLKKRLRINAIYQTISYGKSRIVFEFDKELEPIITNSPKRESFTIVADEIINIPSLIDKISHVENKYDFKFKKILIVSTPFDNNIQNEVRDMDKKIKVFIWNKEVEL